MVMHSAPPRTLYNVQYILEINMFKVLNQINRTCYVTTNYYSINFRVWLMRSVKYLGNGKTTDLISNPQLSGQYNSPYGD